MPTAQPARLDCSGQKLYTTKLYLHNSSFTTFVIVAARHELLLDILLVWPAHVSHNCHRSLPPLHWYVFWSRPSLKPQQLMALSLFCAFGYSFVASRLVKLSTGRAKIQPQLHYFVKSFAKRPQAQERHSTSDVSLRNRVPMRGVRPELDFALA